MFLESDIDLSSYTGHITPIGPNLKHSFAGTFNGQGHIISHFSVTADVAGAGLFGYTQGATVKNVILDATCSVASTSTEIYTRAGGLVGHCEATDKAPCSVENSVSTAKVSYAGKNTYIHDMLGGIIGSCNGKGDRGCEIKNVISYGTVSHSGPSKETVMGRLCGVCSGGSTSEAACTIYNSAGYGSLVHNGEAKSWLIMGGILGKGVDSVVENCVGVGSLVSATTVITGNSKVSVGGIAGSLRATNVIRAFWDANSDSGSSVVKWCDKKDWRTTSDTTSTTSVTLNEGVANACSNVKVKRMELKAHL